MGVRRIVWTGALMSTVLAAPARAQAPGELAPIPPPLHRSGKFHLGISAEASLGAIEAFTSHDTTHGVDLEMAAQIDVNPRWSLRAAVGLGAGGFGHGEGYGELAMSPGVLYRFRHADNQRWTPYVGGGMKLALVGVGYQLLGRPLAVACCHSWGGDGFEGGGGGHADPNTENAFVGFAPELYGGVELALADWLSLKFAGTLGFETVSSTRVFVLRELVGVHVAL